MSGWLKIHRKIQEWEWYDDLPCFRLFTHLLITANYEPSKYKGYDIPSGAKVCGLPKLSEQTGLSIQQLRTALSKLESTGEITVKKTNKFSIISILNWKKYQEDQQSTNSQPTNNQQTSNTQSTTSKEGKNKERKKEEDIGDLDLAVLEFNALADDIGLSKVQRMTDSRKKSLMCRLDECGGIEGWRVALSIVRESPFLRGDNDRGWKADFDFMVKQSSFVKIMEGKYNAKKRTQSDRNVESVIEWMDGR